jgi:hypothetical protein
MQLFVGRIGLALGAVLLLSACSSTVGYKVTYKGVFFENYEGRMVPVRRADPATFQPLARLYARDKDRIFNAWDVVEGAYLDSYLPGGPKTALYDKKHNVLVCDYTTYHPLKQQWYVDKYCAYKSNGVPIKDVDVASFEIVTAFFAKDHNHVYLWSDILPGADPATFKRMCGHSIVNARDAKQCYWFDHVVPCDCGDYAREF